jgi:hypothetical protein
MFWARQPLFTSNWREVMGLLIGREVSGVPYWNIELTALCSYCSYCSYCSRCFDLFRSARRQAAYLTLILLTWRILWALNYGSKWQMGFNSAFKGLRNKCAFCTQFPPLLFFCGAATQRGSWPTRSWGFWITHNDAAHSVGLLWTGDQLVAETSTWQHTILITDKYPCPPWNSSPRSQ